MDVRSEQRAAIKFCISLKKSGAETVTLLRLFDGITHSLKEETRQHRRRMADDPSQRRHQSM